MKSKFPVKLNWNAIIPFQGQNPLFLLHIYTYYSYSVSKWMNSTHYFTWATLYLVTPLPPQKLAHSQCTAVMLM